MLLLVMGVAGVGKTTVGTELARQLGWTFLDADDDQPPDNVDQMRAGIALTDAERAPWLAAVRARVQRHLARGENVVLACSALKQAYRDYLTTGAGRAVVVQLAAPEAILRTRLSARRNHFMPRTLLHSQLEALEPPTDAIVIDSAMPVGDVVATIRAALGI